MQKSPNTLAGNADLQWDDIRYFLALARQGSLSGAARQLQVEHTTVARRVQALEDTLHLRLFDRLPRGWQLTPEGETLARQAGALEEEALNFTRAALGVGSVQGTVRLAAPPALVSHFLMPRLAPLRQAWPGIDLDILSDTREANLARHEADLALRLTRPSAPGLTARALGEVGFGLYATAHWRDAPPSAWQFLGYDNAMRDAPQQQWLEKTAGARRFVLRCNDLVALREAARAGLGLAVLPHFLASATPELVPVEQPACPVSRTLWLVMHPDVRRSPRVRAVADALIALFPPGQAIL
ncbi:LysR family transcriptional regulator [Silvimonas iriomotensis]|uniref:LysR family transcriptional regulator n=1 Tax=Silvimonas iriomotensis TaxID=449662 RepID=A0ABQ2PAY8_9NEIS|nr:LysR family transcriptional regulator [Silvimonas iriomotensis]GGP22403.1 LysR family transcriptional regulator [Silvimonas iriomotensis]